MSTAPQFLLDSIIVHDNFNVVTMIELRMVHFLIKDKRIPRNIP